MYNIHMKSMQRHIIKIYSSPSIDDMTKRECPSTEYSNPTQVRQQ